MFGNVLIVGGGASIASNIIDLFSDNAHGIIVTTREIKSANKNTKQHWVTCDLTDAASIRELVHGFSERHTRFDLVLILAGAIAGKSLEDTTDEMIDTMMHVNFTGPVRLLRDLLPHLNTGARILIVSSVSGERGSYDPVYAGTKGALVPFAKSLATWLGKKLTVTVVTPSAIDDSTMVADMTPERREHHLRNSPTGELVNRDDLARILFDLAQPHWRHTNGAVIKINGGSYV